MDVGKKMTRRLLLRKLAVLATGLAFGPFPVVEVAVAGELRWQIYNLAFRLLGGTMLWPQLGQRLW